MITAQGCTPTSPFLIGIRMLSLTLKTLTTCQRWLVPIWEEYSSIPRRSPPYLTPGLTLTSTGTCFEAPVYIAWSRSNRSALIRVPHYQPGREEATRIEIRCPDPSGNPYLQLAVTLMAGLKGIEEKCEVPEPMEFNLYGLNEDQRIERGIETLPSSLQEAIRFSEESELMKETLGPHSFKRWITLKKLECAEFNRQVTDYEIKKYYPLL
jgi:glutamine synthetase